MKTYLFAYSSEFGTTSDIEDLLDSLEEVQDWSSDLVGAYYLHSSADASELARAIKLKAPPEGRFLVTEITENSDGFVASGIWPFILAPQQGLPSVHPA